MTEPQRSYLAHEDRTLATADRGRAWIPVYAAAEVGATLGRIAIGITGELVLSMPLVAFSLVVPGTTAL